MSKRFKLIAVSLGVLVILGAILAGTALAAGPQKNATGQLSWGCQETGDLLGLTPAEIQAERQAGKSLAEIAAANGVSEDALVDAIIAQRQETIQERVNTGAITQEQATRQLELIEQRVRQMVNRTTIGPMGRGGYCGSGQAGFGMGGMMNRGYWNDQDTGPGQSGPGFGPGMMNRYGPSFR